MTESLDLYTIHVITSFVSFLTMEFLIGSNFIFNSAQCSRRITFSFKKDKPSVKWCCGDSFSCSVVMWQIKGSHWQAGRQLTQYLGRFAKEVQSHTLHVWIFSIWMEYYSFRTCFVSIKQVATVMLTPSHLPMYILFHSFPLRSRATACVSTSLYMSVIFLQNQTRVLPMHLKNESH